MKNPIIWFEIHVGDMNRAKLFYENVFNVKLKNLGNAQFNEVWGFPADHKSFGCSGSLVKVDEIKPGGVSTVIYFSSEDCTTEETRVKEFGGKIETSKFSIGEYGFISLFTDTEGNKLGLHSMN